MKIILKNEMFKCEEIKIEDNESLINYILTKEKPFRFNLYNVTKEEYEKLKNSTNYEYLIPFNSGKPMIGYAPRKGDSYRSSGGLKIQSENQEFYGCFSIDKDRLIYCPCAPKYTQERDAFVYSGVGEKYYTTLPMSEIFKEIIDWNLKFLIDTGRYKKGKTIMESGTHFIELTKEEMLLCANNPEIGKKVFEDHLKKDYFVELNENEKQYKKELIKK